MKNTLPLPPDLLAQMANTQQNPRYHAEGSVLEHTKLVVAKYFELRDQFELTEEERQVLYWAAVLHDVGKTLTTRFEHGRWRSPGHEKAGVPIALDLLMGQPDLTAEMRESILGLVRWHGAPLDWMRYQRPHSELKRLGTRTDLRLLGIFTIFDFQGRICEDQDFILEKITQFQQVEAPKAEYEFGTYASLQSRYRDWNLRHRNAVWNAFRMKEVALLEKLITAAPIESAPTFGKKVFLTIGPPLSGKTHYLQENHPNLFRIDMAEHGMAESDLGDDFYESRKLVEFRHFLTVYLNRHRQVALDGRHLDTAFRKRLAEMIRTMNIELEYLVFQAPLATLHARDVAQTQGDLIRESYGMLEVIHPWEAHTVTYVSDSPS